MTECWPPQDAVPLVAFSVIGDPKPGGSKNAIPLGRRNAAGVFVPYTRKDGTPLVNLQDSSGTAGTNWRADIRAACAAALDHAHELADGPLAVRVTFSHPGPAGRYGSGRNAGVLKPTAARYPHASKLADGTKLARALEDALTSLLWVDDRRVVDMWWSRRFARAGASVEIFTLPTMVGPVAEDGAMSLLGDVDGTVIMQDHGELPPRTIHFASR